MPKMISLHDVLEPLKQALLASRDVIQIFVSKLHRVVTLGDGCWLPKEVVWAGYPCGHPAQNFGQALQIL